MNFFKNPVTRLVPILFLIIACAASLVAQVSVSLVEVDNNINDLYRCYNVVLESTSTQPIGLAGQNYRLYYDSDAAKLQEASIKSNLTSHYESIKVVQHFFDADASGFGVLPFEHHLGFINLATDYKLESGAPIILSKGDPYKVAEMCFDVKDGRDPSFIWGQKDLTQTYATAFVEVSLLQGKILTPAKMSKLDVVTRKGESSQIADVLDVSYFPNPFRDVLNIEFNKPLPSDATLKIKNVWGQLVKEQVVTQGSTKAAVTGADLRNGALIIEIVDGDGVVSTLKAIKIE